MFWRNIVTCFDNCNILPMFFMTFLFTPVDTGRILNVHKTFRRRLLNVLCTFNLRPLTLGTVKLHSSWPSPGTFFNNRPQSWFLNIKRLLTLIRLGFLKVVFFSGGRGFTLTPFDISRKTNLISIELYTIVKQSI